MSLSPYKTKPQFSNTIIPSILTLDIPALEETLYDCGHNDHDSPESYKAMKSLIKMYESTLMKTGCTNPYANNPTIDAWPLEDPTSEGIQITGTLQQLVDFTYEVMKDFGCHHSFEDADTIESAYFKLPGDDKKHKPFTTEGCYA